jgi:hypothetical protein
LLKRTAKGLKILDVQNLQTFRYIYFKQYVIPNGTIWSEESLNQKT